MGLAGQIGLGAAEGLDDIIVQQLAKKKYEEDVRKAQAMEAIQTRGLDQDADQFDRNFAQSGEQFAATNAIAQRNAAVNEGQLGVQKDEQAFKVEDRDFGRAQVESVVNDAATPRPIVQLAKLSQGGVSGLDGDDFQSPEDKINAQKELIRYSEQQQANFRAPAEEEGSIIREQKPDGTYQDRWVSREEARRGVPVAGPAGGSGSVGKTSQATLNALEKIDQLSKEINVHSGPEARLVGGARKVASFVGADDKITEYEGLTKITLPQLARELGHVGVLTQQDVDSVLSGLAKPWSTQGERDLLIGNVKDLITQRIAAAGAGVPKTAEPPMGRSEAGPPAAAQPEFDYVPGKGMVPRR